MPDTDSGATDRLAAVLAERYGLEPCQLTQLPIGQGTINYRADCADREVFVKNYPRHADPPGERAASCPAATAKSSTPAPGSRCQCGSGCPAG